jgi:hypothetical protein
MNTKDSTVKRNPKGWLVFGVLLVGVLGVNAGAFFLISRPNPASPDLIVATATAPPKAAVGGRETATLAAATLAAATPTSTPTRAKPTQVPTPTYADDLFHLAIVHSNDTWGYTEPCG